MSFAFIILPTCMHITIETESGMSYVFFMLPTCIDHYRDRKSDVSKIYSINVTYLAVCISLVNRDRHYSVLQAALEVTQFVLPRLIGYACLPKLISTRTGKID